MDVEEQGPVGPPDHWSIRFMRWCRDEAAALGFGLILIIVLAGIEIWLIKSFLAVDATFIRPLAPPGIDPQVLQDISWALRAFGVIVGMALVYFHSQGMVKWFGTFRWLAGICAVILFAHAMGLAFKSMDDQYKTTAVIEDVADDRTGGLQLRLDSIDSEIAGIRADRDSENSRLQRSIDSITNDGLDNDDEAQEFADKQQENTNAAKLRIDELNREKRALLSESTDVEVQATEDTAQSDSVADLFTGLSRLFTWNWDPAAEPNLIVAFVVGVLFWVFWYGFGEALMILIPPATFAIVLRHREAAEERHEKQKASDRARRGWETRKEKEAAKDDLRIGDEGYWETRIVKAVSTGYKSRKIEGMCATYFGDILPGELREHLLRQIDKRLELPKADPKAHKRAIERGLLSDERKTYLMQDHIDFIFSEGEYAPEVKAQQVNGIDQSEQIGGKDVDDDESSNVPAIT